MYTGITCHEFAVLAVVCWESPLMYTKHLAGLYVPYSCGLLGIPAHVYFPNLLPRALTGCGLLGIPAHVYYSLRNLFLDKGLRTTAHSKKEHLLRWFFGIGSFFSMKNIHFSKLSVCYSYHAYLPTRR